MPEMISDLEPTHFEDTPTPECDSLISEVDLELETQNHDVSETLL